MVLPLRVRSRHEFGSSADGLYYQHGYELAHMILEETAVADAEEVWLDDLIHQFFERALPCIHLVEKICYYFSDQFSYRISWPSTTSKYVLVEFH